MAVTWDFSPLEKLFGATFGPNGACYVTASFSFFFRTARYAFTSAPLILSVIAKGRGAENGSVINLNTAGREVLLGGNGHCFASNYGQQILGAVFSHQV